MVPLSTYKEGDYSNLSANHVVDDIYKAIQSVANKRAQLSKSEQSQLWNQLAFAAETTKEQLSLLLTSQSRIKPIPFSSSSYTQSVITNQEPVLFARDTFPLELEPRAGEDVVPLGPDTNTYPASLLKEAKGSVKLLPDVVRSNVGFRNKWNIENGKSLPLMKWNTKEGEELVDSTNILSIKNTSSKEEVEQYLNEIHSSCVWLLRSKKENQTSVHLDLIPVISQLKLNRE